VRRTGIPTISNPPVTGKCRSDETAAGTWLAKPADLRPKGSVGAKNSPQVKFMGEIYSSNGAVTGRCGRNGYIGEFDPPIYPWFQRSNGPLWIPLSKAREIMYPTPIELWEVLHYSDT
jgi:hypothetical protein